MISAIALNGVVVAALLRPIEKTSKKHEKYAQEEQSDHSVKLIKGDCDTEDKAEKQKCCDLSNMFDFSLLKSVTFLVYGCSCFLCMLGGYIFFFSKSSLFILDLGR